MVYFPGVDGRIEGLDADLLRLYAAERKLTLRFVAIATAAELETALGNGEAHLGVGGLIEPRAPSASASPDAGTARSAIDWTTRLLRRRAGADLQQRRLQARGWDDLDGETVALADTPDSKHEIERLRAAHPAVAGSGSPIPRRWS